MNAPMDQREHGLLRKYEVTRVDGSDAPGERHHGDEYFVLNLTTDKFSWPAIAAYACACESEYPLLASDLRAKLAAHVTKSSEFITVPQTTLPSGLVVPEFRVARYLASKGPADTPLSIPAGDPWVRINYQEAREACAAARLELITESQCLALAHDIVNQDINWTSGKVGEGSVFMGLHKGTESRAMPGDHESKDSDERRWHELSNGERIYDLAGNAFSWVVDDIQGDIHGLSGVIKADSPSLVTAPFPSMERGMGWRPDGERNWSGYALIRGGYWFSGSYAGVFRLSLVWPGSRDGGVGFRCTKPTVTGPGSQVAA